MGRAEIWSIRAAVAAAVVALILLLVTPWRLSWPEQLTVTAIVALQFSTINQMVRRRAARDHAWLQGYFAGLEDGISDEADRS